MDGVAVAVIPAAGTGRRGSEYSPTGRSTGRGASSTGPRTSYTVAALAHGSYVQLTASTRGHGLGVFDDVPELRVALVAEG